MGLRMRKSIKIAPGVRMNIGKKGVGVSVGTKGLRYSVNSSGRKTTTVGIPGTGISYSTSTSSRNYNSSRNYKSAAYSRNSELKRLQKQQEKLEQLERNRLEVDLFENKIDMIKSIHKECDSFVDWNEIKERTALFNREEVGPKEKNALFELESYKPSFFDKILKKNEKKINELELKVQEAKKEDLEDYNSWQNMTRIAYEICNGDIDAYLKVIEEFRPLDDLLEFGSGFEFFIENTEQIEVEFEVNSDTVVPKEVKSLTKTGKISTKQMSKTKYFDVQQDYVCSCAIRIARDMFALLPLKDVIINALDNRLNTATGRYEKVAILSVKIKREILNSLNMDLIDPSDSMSNFECNMKFKKTSGFLEVEKLGVDG